MNILFKKRKIKKYSKQFLKLDKKNPLFMLYTNVMYCTRYIATKSSQQK